MCVKLSIIVPVYKVEQYLRKCIDSILAQTFTDFELILVDDGSPDNCGTICDEYAKEDRRIKVIHQENAGVSAARNSGLDNACGEYIGFVDSDDWIELDMYEILMQDIAEYHSDIAICGLIKAFCNGERIRFSNENQFLMMNNQEAIKNILENKIFSGYLVNRIYGKYLFDGLRLEQDIEMCEDLLLSYYLFKKAKKITYNPANGYYYFQREDSVTKRGFSTELLSMAAVGQIIYQDIKFFYPDIEKDAFVMSMNLNIACGMALISSEEEYEDHFCAIQKKIKENIVGFLKCKLPRFNQKKRAAQLLLPYHFNKKLGWFRNLQNRAKSWMKYSNRLS